MLGPWVNITSGVSTDDADSIVLVLDWTADSWINDSGFAEAAADAFFAQILKLDDKLGGKILASPLHFIGHGRGTSVNTEILQRLIREKADLLQDVQSTTIDPYASSQPQMRLELSQILKAVNSVTTVASAAAAASGLVPVAKVLRILSNVADAADKAATLLGFATIDWSDFKDPLTVNWAGVDFADNYFQSTATGQKVLSLSPLGTSLKTADVNLHLTGLPGFVEDDQLPNYPFTLTGIGINIEQYGVGFGTTHDRAVNWYLGTASLQTDEIAMLGRTEPIWRQASDRFYEVPLWSIGSFSRFYAEARTELGRADPELIGKGDPNTPADGYTYFNTDSWYRAREFETINNSNPARRGNSAIDQTPWEGIGTGWFYSTLGGGATFRDNIPNGSRADPNSQGDDNTVFNATPAVVPGVFNGNFQASFRPVYGRTPIPTSSWYEMPGWSFHGGGSYGSTSTAFQSLAIPGNSGLRYAIDESKIISALAELKDLDDDIKDAVIEFFSSIADKIFKFEGLEPVISDFRKAIDSPGTSLLNITKHFATFVVDTMLKGANIVKEAGPALQHSINVLAMLETLGVKKLEVGEKPFYFDDDLVIRQVKEKDGSLSNLVEKARSSNGVVKGGKGLYSAWQLKKTLSKIATGVVGDVAAQSMAALVSFMQQYLIDYHYVIASGDHLEHNVMYFPDASTLAVDIGWGHNADAPAGANTLEVYAVLDNGRHDLRVLDGYSLRSPVSDPLAVGNDFVFGLSQRVYLEVPEALKGKVGTLIFKNKATDTATEHVGVMIDNIEFDTGVKIADSSGDANDLTLFFSDAGDVTATDKGTGALVSARTTGTGVDRQELTFTNRQTTELTITVDVGASKFVNLAGVTGNWNFNNGKDFTDGSTTGRVTVTIPPRGEVVLGVTARMTADQVAQLGKESVHVLSSSLTVSVGTPVAGTGERVQDQQTINMFYLLDIGDDDSTDGVIKVAATAEDTTRKLVVENESTTLDLVLNKDLSTIDSVKAIYNLNVNSADPVSAALTGNNVAGSERGWLTLGEDGGKTNITFKPKAIGQLKSGTAFRFRDQAELGLSWGGGLIGKIKIEAAAAPAQVIGLELPELKNVVKAEVDRMRSEDPDGSIAAAFPSGLSDLEWEKLQYSVLTAVKDILYDPNDSSATHFEVVLGSGDINVVYDPSGESSGDITRSFATFDFNKEIWNAGFDDRTQAQKHYLVDSLFNTEDYYQPNYSFVKDKVILRDVLPDTIGEGQPTRIVGDFIGRLLAHEILHTLGLPDRYDPTTGQPLGSVGIMNSVDSKLLTEDEILITDFAFNFDDPELPDSVIDQLIAFLQTADNAGALDGLDRGYLAAPPDGAGLSEGWTSVGNVAPSGDGWLVDEGAMTVSGLRAPLTVPEGAQSLTINVHTKLNDGLIVPPDAFEIALLDALGNSLVGLSGLTYSDAAFNMQASGTTRFSEFASVGPAVSEDGYEFRTVTFDVSSLAAGTTVHLYLDLIGFGALDSAVQVDSIAFQQTRCRQSETR